MKLNHQNLTCMVVITLVGLFAGVLVHPLLAPALVWAQPATQEDQRQAAPKVYPVQRMLQLLKAGNLEGVKEYFREQTNRDQKMRMAQKPIAIGVQDEEYFNYLAEQIREVLKKDIPFPLLFGADGHVIKGQVNPAFLAWCSDHQQNTSEVWTQMMYFDPAPVDILARTADPRAYTLFLQGLESSNYMVAGMSSRGLGMIGDRQAIPVIQKKAIASPMEVRWMVAGGGWLFSRIKKRKAFLKSSSRMQKIGNSPLDS